MSDFKLGRRPAIFNKHIPNLLSLQLDTALPLQELTYQKVTHWPMLLNNEIGDCTIAAIGHILEYWNWIEHKIKPTMSNIEALLGYEAVGHYIPNDPSTDNGCTELDVLNYFKNHGFLAAGKNYKLSNFLSIDTADLNQIKTSIHHLGNAYIGLNLPSNCEQTTLWTIDPNATILGGHAVNYVGYDDTKSLFYIISWGTVVPMTYAFHQKYVEESWALYSSDWVERA